MHDKGLTTTIDWKNQDAYGRSLSSEKRSQMNRLRKWQERIRTKDAGERNLQFALSETDRMASALGVPRSVREVASVLYRRALDEDLIRGRSIEGVATGTLYAACRMEGIPRSLDEIAAVSRVDRMEIGRTYRYISKELSLEMQPVDPKKYVPRFCSELELSEEVESKANEIIDTTAEQGCYQEIANRLCCSSNLRVFTFATRKDAECSCQRCPSNGGYYSKSLSRANRRNGYSRLTQAIEI